MYSWLLELTLTRGKALSSDTHAYRDESTVCTLLRELIKSSKNRKPLKQYETNKARSAASGQRAPAFLTDLFGEAFFPAKRRGEEKQQLLQEGGRRHMTDAYGNIALSTGLSTAPQERREGQSWDAVSQ